MTSGTTAPSLTLSLLNFAPAGRAHRAAAAVLRRAQLADRVGIDRVTVVDHVVMGDRIGAYDGGRFHRARRHLARALTLLTASRRPPAGCASPRRSSSPRCGGRRRWRRPWRRSTSCPGAGRPRRGRRRCSARSTTRRACPRRPGWRARPRSASCSGCGGARPAGDRGRRLDGDGRRPGVVRAAARAARRRAAVDQRAPARPHPRPHGPLRGRLDPVGQFRRDVVSGIPAPALPSRRRAATRQGARRTLVVMDGGGRVDGGLDRRAGAGHGRRRRDGLRPVRRALRR